MHWRIYFYSKLIAFFLKSVWRVERNRDPVQMADAVLKFSLAAPFYFEAVMEGHSQEALRQTKDLERKERLTNPGKFVCK